MAGIYLHIPFCRQACHYCNFHFSTSLKRKNDFVVALLKEIDLQKEYIGSDPVETIYFGGGTPSLLTGDELGQIMEKLHSSFTIDPKAEITLEANPDDFDNSPEIPGDREKGSKLKAWKKAGINRLSIGIQSFFEEDLKWMNRAHNAGQAIASIGQARQEGFVNISVDLIYGGPTLPDDHWKKNVEQAIRLNIPHLSCYALTVEPKTALDKMIHLHKKAPVDADDQARQFILLMDWMEKAGYEHYEISNFAKPGQRSRHNSSYWQGKSYLGLGPSAHSYNGLSRQWNVANNALYIDSLLAGGLPFEKEELTASQQLNEYIMISLRTMEGLDPVYASEKFGAGLIRELMGNAESYLKGGKMELKNGRLVLNREGKLLADGIAADLFF
ncbi:radical SAM family heme chaperone HemW [Flavitalea flava]